jgi:hypothetical protein
VLISGTYAQEHKSNVATPLGKLCRMLRSMLRKFPQAHLLNTVDAFGVSLDANTYMQVSYSGQWTPEAMRDCLALFATWLVADPAPIMRKGVLLAGVLQTVEREYEQSVTLRG